MKYISNCFWDHTSYLVAVGPKLHAMVDVNFRSVTSVFETICYQIQVSLYHLPYELNNCRTLNQ
jgi:hypothetical protein